MQRKIIVCIVMIVAMVLVVIGCKDNKKEGTGSVPEEKNILGEGKTQFTLMVTDDKGKTTAFEIHTDKTMVGEALQELGLIEGEEGPFGLYVTTVNGMSFDYDKNGKYWSFYVGGKYAQQGIDVTVIEDGAIYSLVVEKA